MYKKYISVLIILVIIIFIFQNDSQKNQQQVLQINYNNINEITDEPPVNDPDETNTAYENKDHTYKNVPSLVYKMNDGYTAIDPAVEPVQKVVDEIVLNFNGTQMDLKMKYNGSNARNSELIEINDIDLLPGIDSSKFEMLGIVNTKGKRYKLLSYFIDKELYWLDAKKLVDNEHLVFSILDGKTGDVIETRLNVNYIGMKYLSDLVMSNWSEDVIDSMTLFSVQIQYLTGNHEEKDLIYTPDNKNDPFYPFIQPETENKNAVANKNSKYNLNYTFEGETRSDFIDNGILESEIRSYLNNPKGYTAKNVYDGSKSKGYILFSMPSYSKPYDYYPNSRSVFRDYTHTLVTIYASYYTQFIPNPPGELGESSSSVQIQIKEMGLINTNYKKDLNGNINGNPSVSVSKIDNSQKKGFGVAPSIRMSNPNAKKIYNVNEVSGLPYPGYSDYNVNNKSHAQFLSSHERMKSAGSSEITVKSAYTIVGYLMPYLPNPGVNVVYNTLDTFTESDEEENDKDHIYNNYGPAVFRYEHSALKYDKNPETEGSLLTFIDSSPANPGDITDGDLLATDIKYKKLLVQPEDYLLLKASTLYMNKLEYSISFIAAIELSGISVSNNWLGTKPGKPKPPQRQLTIHANDNTDNKNPLSGVEFSVYKEIEGVETTEPIITDKGKVPFKFHARDGDVIKITHVKAPANFKLVSEPSIPYSITPTTQDLNPKFIYEYVPPKKSLTVKVEKENGVGIQFAKVKVYDPKGKLIKTASGNDEHRTGSDGTFKIDVTSRGSGQYEAEVTFIPSGYANIDSYKYIDISDSNPNVELKFPYYIEKQINVTVVDSDVQPVKGIKVKITDENKVTKEADTNDNGVAKFTVTTNNSYKVEQIDTIYGHHLPETTSAFVNNDNISDDVTIYNEKIQKTLSVTILQEDTLNPVQKARVEILIPDEDGIGYDEDAIILGKTDANGYLKTNVSRNGTYLVQQKSGKVGYYYNYEKEVEISDKVYHGGAVIFNSKKPATGQQPIKNNKSEEVTEENLEISNIQEENTEQTKTEIQNN